MDERDLRELAQAKRRLEHPGLAARLTAVLGTPIEKGLSVLPARWGNAVHAATRAALERALGVALRSLGEPTGRRAAPGMHRLMAGASGAAGGAFGLASLSIELPVSTVIMLRSIADIARAEGEDLRAVEAQLACLEVLALGGPSKADDATETGYYAVRAALGKAVSEAAAHVARRGLTAEGAPALVRLVTTIAQRFGIVVTEKVAAQLVPVIGAVGGATVNVLFMDHFQEMARGHFVVRRLERKYGAGPVREAYRALA